MLSWEYVLGGLCTGLVFITFFASGLRAMAKERRRRWAESLSILRGWADENGYTVRFQEREPLWASPFPTSGGQVVYRLIVEDRRGQRRRGWAVCGGYFLGTLSRRVVVKWDEPESVVALSSPKDDALWDEEVDA
jgi:hypothetical protein